MVDPSQNIHEFVRYGYVLVLATGSTPISLAFPSKEGRNKDKKTEKNFDELASLAISLQYVIMPPSSLGRHTGSFLYMLS